MTFNGFNGAINLLHNLQCAGDMPSHYRLAIKEVINVLLMNAQEVKHGHWEWDGYVYEAPWRCSECSCLNEDDSNYCPNCGAKMDKVEQCII